MIGRLLLTLLLDLVFGRAEAWTHPGAARMEPRTPPPGGGR